MLRSTFLHIPGVGALTETELWRRGVTDWGDFPESRAVVALPPSRREEIARHLSMSERALGERDADFFAMRLPPSELWRLYPTFHPETAFLDIETTSLSPYEGIVTVVTVHGGGATRTFIADDTLEELPAYLKRFKLLVTFNGRLFDVPFLEAQLPQLRAPSAHIDLRYVLYRLGYSGGLKRIEQQLGLGDREGVEGVNGLEAVRLWAAFRRGNREALDRLVRYNRADTVNLEPLLDFATGELEERLLGARRVHRPVRPTLSS